MFRNVIIFMANGNLNCMVTFCTFMYHNCRVYNFAVLHNLFVKLIMFAIIIAPIITLCSQTKFAMKIIVYFSIIFCLAKANGQREVCDHNEVSDPCKNPCQPTCETPTPPVCNFLRCEQGCVCKPNLIRKTRTGPCILPHQCPRVPKCNTTNNEQFYECTSPCTRTCQSQCRPLEICSAEGCARKCDCKPGYLRNELTSQCVPERQCPRCHNCPRNEVYSQCGAACVGTCQNPDVNPYCFSDSKPCSSGCICAQGLIRDEISRRCITRQRCYQIQEHGFRN